MLIGVRKFGDRIDFWSEAYTQTRIDHNVLADPPYNFTPMEVPDEYVKDMQSSDFNEDMTFNVTKYKNRKAEELKQHLREERQYRCFDIVNRGEVWYATLTQEQFDEIREWYDKWLHITDNINGETKPEDIVEPEMPKFIKVEDFNKFENFNELLMGLSNGQTEVR